MDPVRRRSAGGSPDLCYQFLAKTGIVFQRLVIVSQKDNILHTHRASGLDLLLLPDCG